MKGWKTILLAASVAVIGALEALDWTNIIKGDNAEFIIAIIGVAFAYLRSVTNTPVGKKTVNPDKENPGGKD